MKYDVVVVGAGPAGTSTAFSAANGGANVLLLEEDREVGSPVRCAGLVLSKEILQLGLNIPKRIILNTLRRYKVVIKEISQIEIAPQNYEHYVLDRREFDKFLAYRAVDVGVELWVWSKATNVERRNDEWLIRIRKKGEIKEICCKVLVAADGWPSEIAKHLGLPHSGESAICAQYEGHSHEIDPNVLEIYLGEEYAPGCYVWIVPIDEHRVRVGLGVRDYKNPFEFLDKFISKRFDRFSPLSTHTGQVPLCGPLSPSYTNGGLAVGNAAGQVNPMTGEGIIPSIRCGLIAGEVIGEAVMKDNVSTEILSKYEERVNSIIGKKFRLYLKARKVLEKMSSKDIERLGKAIESREIIDEINRGNYRKAAFKLLIRFPGLLGIVKEFL